MNELASPQKPTPGRPTTPKQSSQNSFAEPVVVGFGKKVFPGPATASVDQSTKVMENTVQSKTKVESEEVNVSQTTQPPQAQEKTLGSESSAAEKEVFTSSPNTVMQEVIDSIVAPSSAVVAVPETPAVEEKVEPVAVPESTILESVVVRDIETQEIEKEPVVVAETAVQETKDAQVVPKDIVQERVESVNQVQESIIVPETNIEEPVVEVQDEQAVEIASKSVSGAAASNSNLKLEQAPQVEGEEEEEEVVVEGEEGEEGEESQELEVTPDMFVIALANYTASEEDQISLVAGETYIRITADYGNGWSFGCTVDGTVQGVFPQTFVRQKEL